MKLQKIIKLMNCRVIKKCITIDREFQIMFDAEYEAQDLEGMKAAYYDMMSLGGQPSIGMKVGQTGEVVYKTMDLSRIRIQYRDAAGCNRERGLLEYEKTMVGIQTLEETLADCDFFDNGNGVPVLKKVTFHKNLNQWDPTF